MSAVRVTMALLTTALLTTAACGQSSGTDPGGSVPPTSPTDSPGTSSGSSSDASTSEAAEGPADLTIVVNSGSGSTTWHLTCAPTGGNHPNPAKACAVLASHGRTALPAVPGDRMCTQQFGGPQTAHITGTWQGKAVNARLSRTNGCEIARWEALAVLLPSERA